MELPFILFSGLQSTEKAGAIQGNKLCRQFDYVKLLQHYSAAHPFATSTQLPMEKPLTILRHDQGISRTYLERKTCRHVHGKLFVIRLPKFLGWRRTLLLRFVLFSFPRRCCSGPPGRFKLSFRSFWTVLNFCDLVLVVFVIRVRGVQEVELSSAVIARLSKNLLLERGTWYSKCMT